MAAKDHCDDIGPTDTFGHFGSDESSPFDRISRYGKPGWWRGENLWRRTLPIDLSGEDVDKIARDTVLGLFIDDARAGRPNRHRLLNPEFKMVGIYSCGWRSNQAQSITVVDYAGSLKLNSEATQGVMAA